ncbi:MAG TPA: hypothetical protein V6D48_06985 [Oculatellaceae cyanobacterium]
MLTLIPNRATFRQLLQGTPRENSRQCRSAKRDTALVRRPTEKGFPPSTSC